MALYIAQVILFQALFLMVYRLWLHKETHFNFNRVYLLVTPVLAMLLPFFNVDLFVEASAPVTRYIQELPAIILGETEPQTQVVHLTAVTIQARQDLFDPALLVPLLYALGVLFSIMFFTVKYTSVLRFFRFKRKEDKRIIHIPNSTAAFTFFNTIFMGEKIDALARKQILEHEQVHVNQKHGVDLLFFEILRIVMWFNPMIFLYQKTIAEVHEFIADRKAAKEEKSDYLNQLLNAAFGTKQVSFINTFFNHSLTKKRIIMLRSNSKTISKLKYLMVLPLLGVMLFVAACTQDDKLNDAASKTLDEQIADLRVQLDNSENISLDQAQQIQEILRLAKTKQPEVIEVVEEVRLEQSMTDGIALNEAVINDVPYAVVEQVPVFPGCENLDNAVAKECMSSKISRMVSKEFNTGLGKELGLKGVIRVYTRFQIDANGDVTDIGSRGPHPAIEEEAERVIKLLPKMQPGKQRGENVNVLYSLPIVFQGAE